MLELAVTPAVWVMPIASSCAAAAGISLVVGLAALLSRWRTIAQTTLFGAWWWTLAALVAWSGVEFFLAISGQTAAAAFWSPLRLAALSLSLCPVMALLGAKRPQHNAWNFVVLSLWGILVLPAIEVFVLRRGQHIHVGDARSWFLWILIVLGPINFVPTRYWLASLLAAAGQIIAFSPHLALIGRPLTPQPEMIGLLLAVGGLFVAALASRNVTRAAHGYDRAWLDFRDSFGLFWALRVQERMNAAGRQYGWDLELTWRGFRRPGSDQPLGKVPPAIEVALRTTFKGLLRRFVSNAWLATCIANDR